MLRKGIAEFYRVSEQQFIYDFRKNYYYWPLEEVRHAYERVKLPKRATVGSAGYDFFAPFNFDLASGKTIEIPTGIRVDIDEDWFLAIIPRSGLGFKYRMQLDNTIGIIDSDYYHSDNEGHIWIKLTNDSKQDKLLRVSAGDGIAQGVFLPYGITRSDKANGIRNGGFGSTGGVYYRRGI